MSMVERMASTGLSIEEMMALERAVSRCCTEADSLIRQIGTVYLRGMCDMLCIQGRLSKEAAEKMLKSVEPC